MIISIQYSANNEPIAQWYGGVSEVFEQFPCDYEADGAEVYLSPWYHGQKLEIQQIWENKEV